jgi:hypothetical protein
VLDIPLIVAILQLAALVLGEGPHYPNEPLDMSLCLTLYLGLATEACLCLSFEAKSYVFENG